ncbi:MAG: NAD-dependent epimerase/dehydratase family protein [Thermoleophilaceae bacterium]
MLVTGGTGFLGTAVVQALLDRGDDVRVMARSGALPPVLADGGVEVVRGDVLDRRAVRRALRGIERVFHTAGLTSLRAVDRERCFQVNVRGTKIVLEECLRAGVERVVHTSSASAVGPAPPRQAADETQLFTAGRLGIAYVNSKHEAEAEAMRLAAHGLPLVCVNPTFVLGPGDSHRSSGALVRRYMLGRIPMYVPGGLNVVDVRDVADGHLRADRRGKVGERYILGGRNYNWDRLFADLGRLSGVAPPPLRLPGPVALRMVQAAEAARLPSPVGVDEVKSASLWWTYKNAKARRELGFRPRPHEETLEQTVAWWLEQDGDRIAAARRAGRLRRRALGAALGGVSVAARMAARAQRTVAA